MITATIQGISSENNCKHITAHNGKIIEGDIAQEKINQLYDDCYEVDLGDKELYCELGNGKLFCAIDHPVRDDIGRIRTALIVWDKNTPQKNIQDTIEVMGLSHSRLLELENEYNSLKAHSSKKRSKKGLYIACGVAIIAITTIILLKK